MYWWYQLLTKSALHSSAFARPTMSSFFSFDKFSKVFCLGSSQPRRQLTCSDGFCCPLLAFEHFGSKLLNSKSNLSSIPSKLHCICFWKKHDVAFLLSILNTPWSFVLCRQGIDRMTRDPSTAPRTALRSPAPHGFGCFRPFGDKQFGFGSVQGGGV